MPAFAFLAETKIFGRTWIVCSSEEVQGFSVDRVLIQSFSEDGAFIGKGRIILAAGNERARIFIVLKGTTSKIGTDYYVDAMSMEVIDRQGSKKLIESMESKIISNSHSREPAPFLVDPRERSGEIHAVDTEFRKVSFFTTSDVLPVKK